MLISRILLILSVLLAVCFLFLHFGWWTLVPLIVLAARQKHRELTAYGTARWAVESDLNPKSKGLLIGRLSVPKRSLLAIFNPRIKSRDACKMFWGERENPLVRIPVTHAAIFAPTGAGKNVSFVITHLLSCADPMVVLDFKGENARITSEFRRKKFGHMQVMLDPFRQVTDHPDSFNPPAFIRADSRTALDECRDLANALVVRTGQEKEPHWCDAAEMLIGGIASFVVQHAPEHDRSLQTVRGILADPEELEASIQVMRQSPAWDGMLARLGNQLSHFKDKELASTMTTTGRFMRFLDSLAVAESTRSSSFDPAGLLDGKMDIFLVLPPEHQRAQSALLRMWIGSLLHAVVKGGLRNRSVWFVIDEAASLGHLEALDDAIDKYRAYGIKLLLFYQSMGQLKQCWPDGRDQVVLSNVTQTFFAVNDYPTAEYVSNFVGEETILVDSGGTSRGRSRQSPDHGNQGSTSYSVNSNNNWRRRAGSCLSRKRYFSYQEEPP